MTATIAGRFTIRWDESMGCYRVSVPNLCSDGEPVEVVDAREYERVRARFERAEDQKLQAYDHLQVLRHALEQIESHGAGEAVRIARKALGDREARF